ncbi:MAG: aldo/keto reductase [Chromatiaceae bacterium]|nr:MAG: aldo/keto reductase [Chromatiaceae bacterium]
MSLPLRPLGQTDLQVTRIGLGLAALGRPGYINLGHGADLAGRHTPAALQAHCLAMLDAAWALGLRYFDAARSYGAAETFLGEWLRTRGHTPAVGSKWGYTYTADWRIEAEHHEVKDHHLPVLERQWAESRTHLGDWLRLYQIHSATLQSGVLADPAVLSRLAQIKANGVAIGLTLSGPAQATTLHQALAVQIDGVRLFDTVQATWNLLEPSCGSALAEAAAAGLGVLVKEALANGRLTARNTAPEFARQRVLLNAEARRLGVGLDALALAAALAQPWADVVLSGAGEPEQLVSNLQALTVTWDAAASACTAALAEPPAQYWQTRAALAWN